MGRDKANVRLTGRTLLELISHTVRELHLSLRVIRRDKIPRCGPMGGIYTGLATSRKDAELFLACDMPFVSGNLLLRFLDVYANSGRAVFTRVAGQIGFPCLIPRQELPMVDRSVRSALLSIHDLARTLRANYVSSDDLFELSNINTQVELERVREQLRRRSAVSK
jgi:molybdopterin-guanine dinucleotide biosynthesis protein A